MKGGLNLNLIQIQTTINPHPFPSRTKPISATAPTEIRVCTNRTCRRQGSPEVLQILSGIAPPTVSVNSCGCLGRCGSGPNLVVLPSETFVNHCATAARAAQVMSLVCGLDSVACNNSLEALSLRKKAEIQIENGDFATAESLLSQTYACARRAFDNIATDFTLNRQHNISKHALVELNKRCLLSIESRGNNA